MTVRHLLVGPEHHGVVLHGRQIAEACGHEATRVRGDDAWPDLRGADVVHVPFTDRVFAPHLGRATQRFRTLRDHVARSGATLSVTLHDVPHDDSALQRRRLELYREVIAAARGIVVNSTVELGLIERLADPVHSLRLAPLPVLGVSPATGSSLVPGSVAVLGFVYPDRGYEDVIAALPEHAHLVALGCASEGHDDLPVRYERRASGRWTMTGYLDDDDLGRRLVTAAVPVAPNRRVTASASVNSWIAHGRRPLVPDSPFGREVAAERPGTVTLYDPDCAGGLRAAIVHAFAEPGSTWIADGLRRGPSLDEVADIYRSHLAACAPPLPVLVGTNRVLPGNRWDLLDGLAAPPARIAVVIPYYDAQPQLDRTLAALARQTVAGFEVVVADDGSPNPPDTSAAGRLTTRVVHQEDRGFRAAAARNLGAAAVEADVLVFLDADTAPEPDFVASLTRLPALCADTVAVGRRRHADFTTEPPTVLPEPGWLREAYATSRNLLDADSRSYRHVISAVLCMTTRLFDELGGFDERFVGYGGEDWELAHRAWTAGAVLAHVPEAVAWHDGPDWAGRADAAVTGAKNDETLALAALLPDPDERGRGLWSPYPTVVIRAKRMSTVHAVATARTAFAAGTDAGLWVEEMSGPYSDPVSTGSLLRRGTPAGDVLARARCVVDVQTEQWIDLRELPALCAAAEKHGEVVTPALRIRSSHAMHRAARWWPDDTASWSARLFGRHDRGAAVPGGPLDLAGVLRRREQSHE